MKYQYLEQYDDDFVIHDKKVKCFSKSRLEKMHPDGNYSIIGETRKGNRKKELDTVELGGERLSVSEVGGHSRLLFRRVGYIQDVSGGYFLYLKPRWLILWLFLGLLAAGVSAALLLLPKEPAPDTTPPSPPMTTPIPTPVAPPDVAKIKPETDTVNISLPGGKLEFHMANDLSELDGAEVSVYLPHDGREDVIHRQTVTIRDGQLEGGTLDFLSLTFELLADDYDGRLVFTLPDGSTVEHPARIIVRSSKTAKMTIGYANEITLENASGEVTLFYEHGENATHDVILQVILLHDGAETLLGQSGIVHAGETVRSLPLDESAADIPAGRYDGWLRLFLVSGGSAAADTATDIEMHINVR